MLRVGFGRVLLIVSLSAFGADNATKSAVIQGNGAVYVNGGQLTTLTSAFSGDVIQTSDTGIAQLSGVGFMVTVNSNTIVRFRSDGFALDRGGVSMATGKQSSVLARDFKITPTSASWTQFDVLRSAGAIQIFARKNSVTVACGSSSPMIIKEGQQVSREDSGSCGVATASRGAPAAVKGPILASPTAEKVGLAVGGGVLGWVLFQADEPVSPAAP
jgi:hypothetical protein